MNLHEAARYNNVAIHAYVLMTNHVHLLVTPAGEHSITHMMQDTGRIYVRHTNNKYQRSGSLWEGRYKASLIDSEAYLLTCMRYIEMNPVRADMVSHPGDYQWSSYHGNTGHKKNPILENHPIYTQLGTTLEQRQYEYRELFSNHIDKTELHAIREALNQELVLGRDDFKDKIEQMTRRQTRPGINGRPRIEESQSIYYVL
jgi:putative transposase